MPERKLQMRTTRFEMDGKQVTVGVLRKFNDEERVPLLDSLGLVRAVNSEYGTNLKLINPHAADYLLNRTKYWREVNEAFPSPVNLGLGYEKPGVKLGAEIVYSAEGEPRVILPTGKYKGKKRIALAVPELTADDIKKDGSDIRIEVPEDRLVVVRAFPEDDGWYMPHDKTKVPHGKEVKVSDEARHLWRRNDKSYAGLLVYSGVLDADGRYINADHGPSSNFGVAVEVPEKDVAKIEAPGSRDKG